MKRFKIENKVNGNKFEVHANELTLLPEFGKPERWINQLSATDAEKAAALETRIVDDRTEIKLAAEFTVIEEDMTAEIAAKATDDAAQEQAHQFLKGLKKSDLVDVATCANAIMKIVKHLRADK